LADRLGCQNKNRNIRFVSISHHINRHFTFRVTHRRLGLIFYTFLPKTVGSKNWVWGLKIQQIWYG
jgi:hypothetical protein